MFNRNIQVKVTKPKKGSENTESDTFSVDTAVIVDAMKDVMEEVAKYIAGYILLDTARKVAIAWASKPPPKHVTVTIATRPSRKDIA